MIRRGVLSRDADDDAFLRALQTETSARAGVPVRSATRAPPVQNPKIWDSDIKPLRRRKIVSDAAFWSRFHAAVRMYGRQGMLKRTLEGAARVLFHAVKNGGEGFARLTFDGVARALDACRETARKAIRWLEAAGLLDTFNVMTRFRGAVRRDANLYQIPDLPTDPDRSFESDIPARIARCAEMFGLAAREIGVNVTAAIGRRLWPTRRREAPS